MDIKAIYEKGVKEGRQSMLADLERYEELTKTLDLFVRGKYEGFMEPVTIIMGESSATFKNCEFKGMVVIAYENVTVMNCLIQPGPLHIGGDIISAR